MVELNKQFTDDVRYIKQLNEKLINETVVLFSPKRKGHRITKHYGYVDGVIKEVDRQTKYPWLFKCKRKQIESFADVIEMLDNIKDQYIMLGQVRNDVIDNRTEMRRLKNEENGVFDYRRRLCFLDLDHLNIIPNLPIPTLSAQHAQQCIEHVLSYAPPALQKANKIVRFSSSTGIIDGKVGLHAFVIFDELQSEDSLKAIQNGINRYMQRRILEIDGVTVKETICDPMASIYNQPLFVAPPVCKDGIAAPFSTEERRHFFVKETQHISTGDLLCEIDADDAFYKHIKAKNRPVTIAAIRKKIREAAPAIFSDPSILDIAFARSQKKPIKFVDRVQQNPDGWVDEDLLPYRKQCIELFNSNVLTDAITLIQACGKMSGQRQVDNILTMLVSLAVKKLPLSEISEERVVAITDHIAELIFTNNDVIRYKVNDWIVSRKYCSIVRRAYDAASGNKVLWGGRADEDKRYGYTQQRIRAELISVLGDEAELIIRELNLTTLFCDSDKKDKRRRDKGIKTAEELCSDYKTYKYESQIVNMSERNMSNREIARIISDYWQVDLSESVVRRTLSRVRRPRPSTVLPHRSVGASPILNDVDHSLTSRSRDNEIVNITNTTDNLVDSCDLDIPCDLSIFDNLVPINEIHKTLDFYSKCDPFHLVDEKRLEAKEVITASNNVININTRNVVRSIQNSIKSDVSHSSDVSNKALVGHVDDVSYRYHVSSDLSEIHKVGDDFEIEDGYPFDVTVCKSQVSFNLDPCMPPNQSIFAKLAVIVNQHRKQLIDRLAA